MGINKENELRGPVEKFVRDLPDDAEFIVEGFVGMFLGVVKAEEEEIS